MGKWSKETYEILKPVGPANHDNFSAPLSLSECRISL